MKTELCSADSSFVRGSATARFGRALVLSIEANRQDQLATFSRFF